MALFWDHEQAVRLKADQKQRALVLEQMRLTDTLKRSPVTRGVFSSGGAQGSQLGWQTDAAAGATEGYIEIQVEGVTKKIEYLAAS